MKSPKNIVKALTLTALILSSVSVDAAAGRMAAKLINPKTLNAAKKQAGQLWTASKTAASSVYGKAAGFAGATAGAGLLGKSLTEYFTPEVLPNPTKMERAKTALRNGWNTVSTFASDKCAKVVEQVKAHPYITAGAAVATGAVLGTAAYFGSRTSQKEAKDIFTPEFIASIEKMDLQECQDHLKTIVNTINGSDIEALTADQKLHLDAVVRALQSRLNKLEEQNARDQAARAAKAIADAKAAKPVASAKPAKVAAKPVVTTVTVAAPSDKQLTATLNRLMRNNDARKVFFVDGGSINGVTAEDVKGDPRFVGLNPVAKNNVTRACVTGRCAKAA